MIPTIVLTLLKQKNMGLIIILLFLLPCFINLPLQIPDYDLFFGGNDKGRTQLAHVILDKCASLDIFNHYFSPLMDEKAF
ncbi:hypothetical protein [Lactococcus lactis]|uniref:hypothetical protein n=1 Tax=Lactococcus lactis TaxID=1358 RepID=UPI002905F50E|nr:hypothetical protein [Lactococcus lactis]